MYKYCNAIFTFGFFGALACGLSARASSLQLRNPMELASLSFFELGDPMSPLPPSKAKYPIMVKGFNGKTNVLEVQEDTTIDALKKEIQDMLGISLGSITLYANTKRLQPEKKLKEYGISRHSIVDVLANIRGGLRGTIKFFLPKNPIYKDAFSYYEYKYPIIEKFMCRGLNLGGTCMNDGCQNNKKQPCLYYGKSVWVPHGYKSDGGGFQLMRLLFHSPCPMCKHMVKKVNKVLFWACDIECEYVMASANPSKEKVQVVKGKSPEESVTLVKDSAKLAMSYRYMYIQCREWKKGM